MNKITFVFALFAMNTAVAQNYRELLIPYPQDCKFGTEKFILSDDFSVSVSGNPGSRVFGAATRMLNRLKGRTGLFINQNEVISADSGTSGKMLVQVVHPGVLKVNEDESYTLDINTNHIILKAQTDFGAVRGMETLLQLLQNDKDNYYFNNCSIHDFPRFTWRGLMIDVCRHFMPIGVVERNIDAMAAVKLNVLHLHLSDDQGFRVECKTFPKLNQLGSDGQYFTQIQIKEIIGYAADRGIRVVPEFDIPGHATSWITSYPELASGPGPYTLEHKFGIFDPTIDPTKESTYQFFDAFFKEMASLFPDDYIHIGGDENNGKEWDKNTSIREFKKLNHIPDNQHLQAYFNKRIIEILTRYGKKVIGWDDIMQPGLSKDIIIQSWHGKQKLIDAARNGFPVILSNGYYIDLMQPASEYYLNDPLPEGIPLTENQKKLVLGGEATMWSELVTPENVDSRIWPRTAAIAERLWSPYSIINIDEMYTKLDRVSRQLEELGLTQEKNYDMLLRRLAGSYDIDALKTFVDILEPVKGYDRTLGPITYTDGSPFTHVVDAARPDPGVARNFNTLVDKYLFDRKDKTIENEIRQMLKTWAENSMALQPTINNSPILQEIATLSVDLSAIAKIGLEAMDDLQKNNLGKSAWYESASEKLQRAQEPRGMVQIMVIPGIQKLVNMAMKTK